MIYAGTGPDDLPELMPVLCDEIGKIVQDKVSAEELVRASAQMKSGILMSRESMMSRANQQAKYLINFGEIIDIDQRIKAIESVTADDVRDCAARIFASTPTLASLGPVEKLDSYEHIKEKLAA